MLLSTAFHLVVSVGVKRKVCYETGNKHYIKLCSKCLWCVKSCLKLSFLGYPTFKFEIIFIQEMAEEVTL
jgi:hypothetical protein